MFFISTRLREKWRRIFKQIQRIKRIVGKNWFLHRGIQYNIFGLIPKTSYVTQTLNIKYRGTIEPRATPCKLNGRSLVTIILHSYLISGIFLSSPLAIFFHLFQILTSR